MAEYSVLFVTKISAKNKKDMERKAQKYEEILTKALRKPIYAWRYGEVNKEIKESVKQSTLD